MRRDARYVRYVGRTYEHLACLLHRLGHVRVGRCVAGAGFDPVDLAAR
jgi:hypothetical protein